MTIKLLNWFFVLVLITAAFILSQVMRRAWASDYFVQMLERREGMYPGGTKVLQECSCTIRYLGTRVSGRRYDVMIERLD